MTKNLNYRLFIIILLAAFLAFSLYNKDTSAFQPFFDLFKSEIETLPAAQASSTLS